MMLVYPPGLLAAPRFRGERNNNPCNMNHADGRGHIIPWEGLASDKDQEQDPRFSVFIDPQHGIRSAVINMRTIMYRAPATTIEGLIEVWAPRFENNTEAYIASVCEHMKVEPESRANVFDRKFVHLLLVAIITHENGRCIYPPAIIEQALDLVTWPAGATT